MGTSLEDLRVLRAAEDIADGLWEQVGEWEVFPRDVVGEQLTRAADSIGANIAEAFGRFEYGEKLKFLYYARGSLFETKYWLNRVAQRQLMMVEQAQNYATQLTNLARQINAFAKSIKQQKQNGAPPPQVKEGSADYLTALPDRSTIIFDEDDLDWLETLPNKL